MASIRIDLDNGNSTWYTLREYEVNSNGDIVWMDLHYQNGAVRRVKLMRSDMLKLGAAAFGGGKLGKEASQGSDWGALFGLGAGLLAYYFTGGRFTDGYYDAQTNELVLPYVINTRSSERYLA